MTNISIQKATYSNPEIETLLHPLGGMRRFVNKGDKVLLKVNLLSAREPEKAVTTHPEIVRAVAKAVKKEGGKPYIGDSPSGRFSKRALKKAYQRSGLTDVSKMAIPVLKRAKVRKLWPQIIEYPLLAPRDAAYRGFKLPNTAVKEIAGKKGPNRRPKVTEKCIACGDCEEICPKDAIQIKAAQAIVDHSKCIRCFCCHEVCPEKAIDLVVMRRSKVLK